MEKTLAYRLVSQLVSKLVNRNYDGIKPEEYCNGITGEDIQRSIKEYGRTLVDLPNQAFELADWYESSDAPNTWILEIPLWTKEEGRSDLTLTVIVTFDNDRVIIRIADLHVL